MFICSTVGLGNWVFEAQQLFAMPVIYSSIFSAVAGYGEGAALPNERLTKRNAPLSSRSRIGPGIPHSASKRHNLNFPAGRDAVLGPN
jgi:hypothetical protein